MHSPWGEDWPMMGEQPWGCGHRMWCGGMGHHSMGSGGMRCPCCGRPMYKPSREEILERLETRKKMLEWALERTNKKIESLKEPKQEGEKESEEEEHSHEEPSE